MRKGIGIFLQFILSCVGIIIMGGLPVLTKGLGNGMLDWQGYVHSLKKIILGIIHPEQLIISSKASMFAAPKVRPLFPDVLEPIGYSLTVLLSSFLLACVLAVVFTILTLLMSAKRRQWLKIIFYFFESLPDIFIIMMMQFFVIFLFNKTGILFFDIASYSDQQVYLLPILCLSILPTVQLYRLSMLTFEDEEEKSYVLLARSIGLGKIAVIIKHIFRNAIISVFFQSKKTFWFMLSNLFVLEYLFNIAGITRFLVSHMEPQIFTISLLIFFIPVFIFYSIGEWILSSKNNKGGSLS
jgi:peptide/nickel transport system permease protein